MYPLPRSSLRCSTNSWPTVELRLASSPRRCCEHTWGKFCSKGPKDPVCRRVCVAQAPRGSACRPRFAGFPESADAAIEPEAASRLKQRGLTKDRKGPEQLVGSYKASAPQERPAL